MASIEMPRGKAQSSCVFMARPCRRLEARTPERGIRMDRSELRQFLRQQLEDDTAREFSQLDDSVNLREGLGIDSVDLVTLIVHTQSHLKIEVPSAELEKVTTMGDLLDVLQSRLAGAAGKAA
ncbi:MAG TPA: hypothetical protein DDY78_18390 [Planctomycetales bacterium]|nr:hypothetical protein [Planctomycetales bacterium]